MPTSLTAAHDGTGQCHFGAIRDNARESGPAAATPFPRMAQVTALPVIFGGKWQGIFGAIWPVPILNGA